MTLHSGPGASDDDRRLAALYREAHGALTDTGQHLSEDDWVALATDTVSSEARARHVDHIVACEACATIHRALVALRDDATTIDLDVQAISAGASPSYWRWIAAAAAIGAVGAAVWFGAAGAGIPGSQPATTTAVAAPVTPAPVPSPPTPAALPPWAATVVAIEVRMPPALALTLRGEAPGDAERRDALVRTLRPALDAYRAGRYAHAAASLAPLAEAHRDVTEIAFYAGASHLLAGDPAAARPLLTAAASSDLVGQDARWLAAVASARLGDAERAAGLLRDLCASRGARSRDACAASASDPPR